MVDSAAQSVDEYLADLAPERAQAIGTVRDAILANLPDGYEEKMSWGMICYEVPLSIEPDTYNGKPLMYAALASQKKHMAVYLPAMYADDDEQEKFLAAWQASGKRVDMGKSCVRFKTLDDLPLDAVTETIATYQVDDFVALVDRVHNS